MLSAEIISLFMAIKSGIKTYHFDLGAQTTKSEYLTLEVWAFSPNI